MRFDVCLCMLGSFDHCYRFLMHYFSQVANKLLSSDQDAMGVLSEN